MVGDGTLVPGHAPMPYSKSSLKKVPVGNVPVPVSATYAVFAALVEMVIVPEREPAMTGVNVTSIWQLAPGASAGPKQVLVCAKSLESGMPIPPTVIGCVPVFVSVTDCAADVTPRSWFPNASDVGEGVATAAAGAAPVPDSATVCGVPDASSVIESDAVREPVAVGVNVTVAVQLAPAARLWGQLFVCAKSPAFGPLRPMSLIASAKPPVLVRVTVWPALVVCVVWEANVSAVGVSAA